ncbi:hypothetical protein [Pedobacter aquatilis]|uniref:hypothetical protein n=1 Tax=Pedobacter aquatilis TaxID=351343 RepID=UPI00292D9C24|nr:hypothetical protein [Pedobacter aquatilis]
MKNLLAVLFILVSAVASAQTVNFSGNYAIDLNKTVFGDAPHGVLPATINVKQEKAQTTIVRQDKDAKILGTEELKFDGSILNRTLPDGVKATSALKWAADKKTFNVDKKAFDGEGQVSNSVKETFSLEDGGKTLILFRDVAQSNGMKYTIKGIYNKQ